MQFQIGDQVVHPLYGVGTVKTVSKQRFGTGSTHHYYEVATNGITVWVPIDEQGATVLRGIASKHSLRECRRLLTEDPVTLGSNYQARQLEIAARLQNGLLPAVCETVRDLRARSARGPLSGTEERILRRIYKALCEEWAASAGVSAETAVNEIEDLLSESRMPDTERGNRESRFGANI